VFSPPLVYTGGTFFASSPLYAPTPYYRVCSSVRVLFSFFFFFGDNCARIAPFPPALSFFGALHRNTPNGVSSVGAFLTLGHFLPDGFLLAKASSFLTRRRPFNSPLTPSRKSQAHEGLAFPSPPVSLFASDESQGHLVFPPEKRFRWSTMS